MHPSDRFFGIFAFGLLVSVVLLEYFLFLTEPALAMLLLYLAIVIFNTVTGSYLTTVLFSLAGLVTTLPLFLLTHHYSDEYFLLFNMWTGGGGLLTLLACLHSLYHTYFRPPSFRRQSHITPNKPQLGGRTRLQNQLELLQSLEHLRDQAATRLTRRSRDLE